jgi:hypothetical protein
MKRSINMLAVALAMFATDALAQDGLLSGPYHCVQLCMPGGEASPIYITQNHDQLNIVDEVGVAGRAQLDWFSRRFWVHAWNNGAVFTADGGTIQFDNGRVWHRGLPLAPPVRKRRVRR